MKYQYMGPQKETPKAKPKKKETHKAKPKKAKPKKNLFCDC